VSSARNHNIRLVIKSSGHDFLGRSSGANSLSIWVHNLNTITPHDTFALTGCDVKIEEPSASVGGGTMMGSMYEQLDKINRTVVGGTGATVSAGGYLTSAGHSILSPKYGLGADQVLEMEVVTPSGDIVIANECQNKDLFWAMRGVCALDPNPNVLLLTFSRAEAQHSGL
jgi:FAD/FMN-containing dehydrogenase